MNLKNILQRNGGRLQFRTPHIEAGKAKGAPLTHYNCEVCQADANVQAVGVWARIGRRMKPIQWVWICEKHEAELKGMAQ